MIASQDVPATVAHGARVAQGGHCRPATTSDSSDRGESDGLTERDAPDVVWTLRPWGRDRIY